MNKEWTQRDRAEVVLRIAAAMGRGPVISPIRLAHIGEDLRMIINQSPGFLNINWDQINTDIAHLENLPTVVRD